MRLRNARLSIDTMMATPVGGPDMVVSVVTEIAARAMAMVGVMVADIAVATIAVDTKPQLPSLRIPGIVLAPIRRPLAEQL